METENAGEVATLLREIRDVQREHLAEYRRVTQQSLELQQKAVARQESFGRVYRGVVAAGGAVVVILIGIVLMLLSSVAGRLR